MRVSILGGSGYVGAELLRILSTHPYVDIHQVTSERFAGKFIRAAHPNLRSMRMRFIKLEQLAETDIVFSCLPHGELAGKIEEVLQKTEHLIDLSADFRLKSPHLYEEYYGINHPAPELLEKFVYGIPEIHRDRMRNRQFISSAGCNATATILALKPISSLSVIQENNIFVDVKVGTSEAGRSVATGGNYTERTRSLRSYKPTGHRHVAEIRQELEISGNILFSATSVPIVRGVLATIHITPTARLSERDLWNVFREAYKSEPFIDIVKERGGMYRHPDPKFLMGSNYCHIGFEVEEATGRIVVLSAIDNLMKGAAGQAVQSMNVMMGWEETTGLESPGFYIY